MPTTREQTGWPMDCISIRRMLAMEWCKRPDWGWHEYEHQHQQCCTPAPEVDDHGSRVYCVVRLVASIQEPVVLQQEVRRWSAAGTTHVFVCCGMGRA